MARTSGSLMHYGWQSALRSTLHSANGLAATVQLLLEKGAKLEAKDEERSDTVTVHRQA